MKFFSKTLSDFEAATNLEWLETNGFGGYASGTAAGLLSRRYHGLLVCAVHPPVGRMVLLSKLDESIQTDAGRYELGTNQFPGAVHPMGFNFLREFERGLFPTFIFEAGGVSVKKTIAAIHGENTTVILYEVVDAAGSFQFELLPLYACRDFHSLSHANDFIGQPYVFDEGIFRTLNYHGCPELFISVPRSEFTEAKGWYYNFEYPKEEFRGMDYHEDLYTHGKFSLSLNKGDRFGIIISTDDPLGKDALQLFETERQRRVDLSKQFAGNDELRRLILAADQFIVSRGKHRSIIAGYHWFADWGRDTMIALPGLCLVTGRFEDAKKILKVFSLYVSQGMLPNRFPDNGEVPEYNTIDATLWFFNAIYYYYKYTGDRDFVNDLLPVLKDIIEAHYKGTRYNIKVDPVDDLLFGGAEGVQLTWMDAKVGDWVVTPRLGKAVEINALWYNALSILGFLLNELQTAGVGALYFSKANKVATSFNDKFWNEKKNSLYDCLNGDKKSDDVRPNQLYAVSLPFKILGKDRGKKVLETVTKHLLTTRGLRSLSPDHKDYRPTYGGNVVNRDGAYHQGTVWSFLIGPYIDALLHVAGDDGKVKCAEILQTFLEHLDEAGVGTISEIFDGEPPHAPRGCIAQAWGVGEVLRVAVEHGLLTDQIRGKGKISNVTEV